MQILYEIFVDMRTREILDPILFWSVTAFA